MQDMILTSDCSITNSSYLSGSETNPPIGSLELWLMAFGFDSDLLEEDTEKESVTIALAIIINNISFVFMRWIF